VGHTTKTPPPPPDALPFDGLRTPIPGLNPRFSKVMNGQRNGNLAGDIDGKVGEV
jgi:hypothetical protein